MIRSIASSLAGSAHARRLVSRGPIRLVVLATSAAVAVGSVQAPTANAVDPPAPDPSLVVQSEVTPTASSIEILQTVDGAVAVMNPGQSTPLPQQCVPLPQARTGDVCVGTPNQLKLQGAFQNTTLNIKAAYLYGGVPETAISWIVDEGRVAYAAIHGVANDGLVESYARAEIRAYVYNRILEILNRELYGDPLTEQEQFTYDWVVEALKARSYDRAKNTLTEYNLWLADRCGYRPPAPPQGSGLPAVPNDLASSALCLSKNPLPKMYDVLKRTPPIETFNTWAAYRDPDPSLKSAGDPRYAQMVYNSAVGYATLAGLGTAVAGGLAAFAVVMGLSQAAVTALAGVTGVASWGATAASAYMSSAAAIAGANAAALAGSVTFVVAAVVNLAIAIWMLVEEQKIEDAIKNAVTAATDDDPLAMQKWQPIYEDLDADTFQDPAGEQSPLRSAGFQASLWGLVFDWTAFDAAGKLIPDPRSGYTGGGTVAAAQAAAVTAGAGAAATKTATARSAENDAGAVAAADPVAGARRFAIDGVQRDSVAVKAPEGELDDQGRVMTGYFLSFDRGWLVQTAHVGGVAQPPVPVSGVNYLDENGVPGIMTVVRLPQQDGTAKLVFQTVRFIDDERRVEHSDVWTFQGPGGKVVTATLQDKAATVPEISLVPTVNGTFLPDHRLTLQSNVSEPGQNANGAYSWRVDRLGSDGSVVESKNYGDLVAFQEDFADPGTYRATVRFQGSDAGKPFDVAGTVEFTIARPAPQVMEAELKNTLSFDGKLFLDLRLMQDTPSEDFDVAVEWADDAMGHQIVKHYQVHCRPIGDGSCETGPLLGPEDAPTNDNWSESPTLRIPDDQVFLPAAVVTITNSYDQQVVQRFSIPGDHRPRVVDPQPHVSMPIGTGSTVRVSEVVPSPLFAEQNITVLPFVDEISKHLPEGVHADVEVSDGRYYLVLAGTPQSDALGRYTFYMPVEQEPDGAGRIPPAPLVTLDIVPSVQPGYRAVLVNVPRTFAERNKLRGGYPDFYVMLPYNGDGEPAFNGTVMCRLSVSGSVVFSKPCEPGEVFPWPAKLVPGDYVAKVWATSDTQPVDDQPYQVNVSVSYASDLTVDQAPTDLAAQVRLGLTDLRLSPTGQVTTPFSSHGYQVTCRLDDATAFTACLDDGTMSVLRTPGTHRLDIRAVAPDGAVTVNTTSWNVATPPVELTVNPIAGTHGAGTRVRVVAGGLLPREHFVVRLGGRRIATGHATVDGTITRNVLIPADTPAGTRMLVVRGATEQRKGSTPLRVTRP